MAVVPLPYKIATLLYCFDPRDNILLLRRAQDPNRGLFSPPGGKLKTDIGESPYACACREAAEETGFTLAPADLHLTGLISEYGYQGQTHWLMFLFDCRRRLKEVPATISEGKFAFFAREEIAQIKVPESDRTLIWPIFDQHRRSFIAYRAECHPHEPLQMVIEETHRQPHLD